MKNIIKLFILLVSSFAINAMDGDRDITNSGSNTPISKKISVENNTSSSITEEISSDNWFQRNKKNVLIVTGVGIAIAGVSATIYYLASPHDDKPLCDSNCTRTLSDKPLCVSPSFEYTREAIDLLQPAFRNIVTGFIKNIPGQDSCSSVFECARQYMCKYCFWVPSDKPDLGCCSSPDMATMISKCLGSPISKDSL